MTEAHQTQLAAFAAADMHAPFLIAPPPGAAPTHAPVHPHMWFGGPIAYGQPGQVSRSLLYNIPPPFYYL